jgi:pilus assembly protein CpaE
MFPSDRQHALSSDSSGSHQLSVLTIALDRESQRLLKLWLSTASLREVPSYPEDNAFLESMETSAPDVCLVDFDKDSRKAFLIAEHIHQESPDTAIFAVSSDAQPDVIIQAMRSGCGEYLFKPLVRDQLLQAITRAGGRRRERKERSNSHIMTFIGAKGGCGVTTIATQLAALLASSGSKKTLLLDLHPSLGDAALYLGFTNSKYHAYELMENTDRLDPALLQSIALHHPSGLDILPAPNDFENTRHAGSGAVSQMFNFLRLWYEFILIDIPAGLNEYTDKLISHSDQLYIVTVAEVSALRNASRIVDYFGQEDVPEDKVRVILNRYEKRSPIPESQIEKLIQRKIFWTVPNQYHQAVKTISSGESKGDISRSELIRNLKGWADSIAAGARAADADTRANKKKRGILGLFETS